MFGLGRQVEEGCKIGKKDPGPAFRKEEGKD